jgi:hypothetical protein
MLKLEIKGSKRECDKIIIILYNAMNNDKNMWAYNAFERRDKKNKFDGVTITLQISKE